MSNYFRQIPDFDYVSRLPNAKIGDYLPLKNLFKKGKIREDIFQNLAFFEKYQIEGNDRPDNVAYKVYNDSSLDWLILLSNNIINIQTEWPLHQDDFEVAIIAKYGSFEALYEVHHYETTEVKNSRGVVIVPAGLRVGPSYIADYYDYYLGLQIVTNNISVPVTNYEYEEKIENDKRNIFILKPRYINIVRGDMADIMTYKKGSSQYKTETLKTADNIRLYS